MRSRKTRAPFRLWIKIAICCFLSALASGCISNKAFWQKMMNKKPGVGAFTVAGEFQKQGLKPPLVLTAEQITNAVVGTETNGVIRVSYGKGLQRQAAIVAGAVEQTFTQTEKALDVPLPIRPHIYLLRLPKERRVIKFRLAVPEPQRTLPWLMVLTNAPPETGSGSAPGAEAPWADLDELPIQIFVITHECFEMHLIDPKELLVMGDISANKGFIHFNLKYHTRWFRDGLANYIGYKASQCFRRQMAEAGVNAGTLRFVENSLQPFSELAKVKEKVFDWNQNSKTDYYDAATALFLLIEQRKGPDAISAIIRELPQVKFPNGKSLLAMIRQKTGLDLRQLVRTFQFPDLGLETRPDAQGRPEIKNVAPNSWAAHANLLKGDVLLEANACPLTGLMDLELQILKALDQGQNLQLAVSRDGERHATEALPLPARKRK